MMSEKTRVSIALAVLMVFGAHASGKPWWVDAPLFGDAFDVGFFAFVVFRFSLSCIDRDVR